MLNNQNQNQGYLFSEPIKPLNLSVWSGEKLMLSCFSPSNLAKTIWEQDGTAVNLRARFQLRRNGLLILNASDTDTGLYRCRSAEHSNAGQYAAIVAEYQVSVCPRGSGNGSQIFPQPQISGLSVAGLQAVIGLLLVSLLALLSWNFNKGHIPLPWYYFTKKYGSAEVGEAADSGLHFNDPSLS